MWAFGISTFVTTPFADGVIAAPRQCFGTHLLLEGHADAIVLDDGGVAAANAGQGLALAVLAQGYRVPHGSQAAEDFAAILGAMMHGFVETHLGYNVARVVIEVFGVEGMDAIESAAAGGLDVFARFRPDATPGVTVPSLMWTLDRATAQHRRSLLLPLFLYAPPRLGFTAAERELLLSALDGRTDRESAQELGIAVTAVKARWSRILIRAADHHLPLGEREAARVRTSARGAQVRHLLLQYLRRHPSELTPFAH